MTSEELSRRIEEERAAIHAEYEQERIAYQKLLRDYNSEKQQPKAFRSSVNVPEELLIDLQQ